MTETILSLIDLLQKHDEGNFLRAVTEAVLQTPAYTPHTRVPRSEDLELCANLLAASIFAIVEVSEPHSACDLPEPLLTVMQGDDLAQNVSDTVRRSRHPAIVLGPGAQR